MEEKFRSNVSVYSSTSINVYVLVHISIINEAITMLKHISFIAGFNVYKALSDLGLNNTKLTDIISIHEKHAKKQLGELNVKSFPRYYNTQFEFVFFLYKP